MNLAFKNCLYLSLGLHFCLLLVITLLSSTNDIKRPFLVFGAHSKKQCHTFYKSRQQKKSNLMVPFIGGHKTGSIKHGKADSGKVGSKAKSRTSSGMTKNLKSCKSGNLKTLRVKKTRTNGKKNLIHQKRLVQNANKKPSESINLPKAVTHLSKTTPKLKHVKTNSKRVKNKPNKKIEKPEAVKAQVEEEKIEIKPESVEKRVSTPVLPDPIQEMPQQLAENSVEPLLEGPGVNDELDTNETSSILVLSLTGPVEPELVFYQKSIQKEVERLWRPPVGVPKNTLCRINFVVEPKGNVKNFEIVKRSSVLIYDLSILRIAHLFKFDKKLWGKSFTVDFCQ